VEEKHSQRIEEVTAVLFHLRYNHQYNSQGALSASVSLYKDGTEWLEYQKSLFGWDADKNLTSHTLQAWIRVNGTYKWADQEAFFYDYDSNGHFSQILEKQFDFSQWHETRKREFVNFEFGGSLETAYHRENGMWEADYEKNIRIDPQGIELENTYKIWNGFTWITLSSDRTLPEYGINDRLEKATMQVFDFQSQTLSNHERWSYENFFTFDPTTSADDLIETEAFVLFPNPATSFVNVRLPQRPSSTTSVEILDTFGKVVSRKMVKEGMDHRISLEGLAGGVYFLRVNGLEARRFVKI
jgi:hypothetical protein